MAALGTGDGRAGPRSWWCPQAICLPAVRKRRGRCQAGRIVSPVWRRLCQTPMWPVGVVMIEVLTCEAASVPAAAPPSCVSDR